MRSITGVKGKTEPREISSNKRVEETEVSKRDKIVYRNSPVFLPDVTVRQ